MVISSRRMIGGLTFIVSIVVLLKNGAESSRFQTFFIFIFTLKNLCYNTIFCYLVYFLMNYFLIWKHLLQPTYNRQLSVLNIVKLISACYFVLLAFNVLLCYLCCTIL